MVPVKFISFICIFLIGSLTTCSNSSEDPGGLTQPSLTIGNLFFNEGDGDLRSIDIEFNLSAVSTETIAVSFHTEDKSAIAGEDYQTAAATLSFAPGETHQTAPINLIPDDNLEFDETFILRLTNVENASIINQEVAITIRDDDTFSPEQDQEGFITPDNYPGMELVWADEFEGDELNETDWNFELGDGCPNLCGWGNSELESYTMANTHLENGKLVITGKKSQVQPTYTSSRLTTKGKQEFQYGRIDIRAKLPKGQGIWPALWMLGANIDQVGWPVCGEIDIMEAVGHEAFRVHGTAHYNNNGHQFTGKPYSISTTETFGDQYHIFTILWQENSIKWFVDYQLFHSISAAQIGPSYPFNNSFFFIANLAIGGNWPGNPDDTTIFPQTLIVDYMRVFQNPNL